MLQRRQNFGHFSIDAVKSKEKKDLSFNRRCIQIISIRLKNKDKLLDETFHSGEKKFHSHSIVNYKSQDNLYNEDK